MKLSDFNYDLPLELIAQKPAEPRDHCRLLILHKNGQIEHLNFFYQIERYLKPGDVLVLNNSKVFPARLFGKKELTHGRVELLLNKEIEAGVWEVVGKNLVEGGRIIFPGSKLEAIVKKKSGANAKIRFNITGEMFFQALKKIGQTPLPPYIKRSDEVESDKSDYQTVYAKEQGSAAAPTAGLHFTESLLTKLKSKGVEIAELTLHVGLGTFAPVKEEEIEKHQIHSEYFTVRRGELAKILKAKQDNRRVIAVGTTSTRVLEHIFKDGEPELKDLSGWTDIFIYPGYKFRCISGMITNFHLPKSTLLMLVSALAGQENIKKAYSEAVDKKYKFFSYGDAMLIIE